MSRCWIFIAFLLCLACQLPEKKAPSYEYPVIQSPNPSLIDFRSHAYAQIGTLAVEHQDWEMIYSLLESKSPTKQIVGVNIALAICSIHQGKLPELAKQTIRELANSTAEIELRWDCTSHGKIALSEAIYLIKEHYGFPNQSIDDYRSNSTSHKENRDWEAPHFSSNTSFQNINHNQRKQQSQLKEFSPDLFFIYQPEEFTN